MYSWKLSQPITQYFTYIYLVPALQLVVISLWTDTTIHLAYLKSVILVIKSLLLVITCIVTSVFREHPDVGSDESVDYVDLCCVWTVWTGWGWSTSRTVPPARLWPHALSRALVLTCLGVLRDESHCLAACQAGAKQLLLQISILKRSMTISYNIWYMSFPVIGIWFLFKTDMIKIM